MKIFLLAVVTAFLFAALLGRADAQGARTHHAVKHTKQIICKVFREARGSMRDCTDAIRVADCETGGTFSVWARNGQYLGLFQMGEWARSFAGHSTHAWGQARAARRLWKAAGWSQWACSPYGAFRDGP